MALLPKLLCSKLHLVPKATGAFLPARGVQHAERRVLLLHQNNFPPGPLTRSQFDWVMMGAIWAQLHLFTNFCIHTEQSCLSTKLRSRSRAHVWTRRLPTQPGEVVGVQGLAKGDRGHSLWRFLVTNMAASQLMHHEM